MFSTRTIYIRVLIFSVLIVKVSVFSSIYFQTIEDVGHHVYSKFQEFNSYVLKACKVSNPTPAPNGVQ